MNMKIIDGLFIVACIGTLLALAFRPALPLPKDLISETSYRQGMVVAWEMAADGVAQCPGATNKQIEAALRAAAVSMSERGTAHVDLAAAKEKP
jgi:hypothetical protein